MSHGSPPLGGSFPYRRTGTLEVALDADHLRRLETAALTLPRKGVHARLLDAAGTRSEEPHLSEAVVGGLLVPSHGYVAAGDLTRALTTAARRHGAQLIERGRVRRIVSAGGDLRVETDRGSLSGNGVVLAAGSWSGQILIEGVDVRLPVRPVRGQLLQLAWTGPTLGRVIWSERCYLVPWEDGTLLVGATVEEAGFDERTTTAGIRDLIEAAAEIVPHVWTAGFTAARAGLRPATPDEVPVIGPSTIVPNLVYATGHYRNGVLLAPLTAQLVADAMLERITRASIRSRFDCTARRVRVRRLTRRAMTRRRPAYATRRSLVRPSGARRGLRGPNARTGRASASNAPLPPKLKRRRG